MNIGLMFINEKEFSERQDKQKDTDKMILNKFKNQTFLLNPLHGLVELLVDQ